MHTLKHLNKKFSIFLLLLHMQLSCARPQDAETNSEIVDPLRKGRYIPAAYGADRGKYVPDDSGRYRHIHIPYDGGYGDRGLAYVHIDPTNQNNNFLNGLRLTSKDHIRFSVDFNFNNNGWQIIQLEWVNDDDETRRYDYKYERQLWPEEGADNTIYGYESDDAPAPSAASGTSNQPPEQSETNVRVTGEYQDNIYNVSYSDNNKSNGENQGDLQKVIGEVLNYVQSNILPTLT